MRAIIYARCSTDETRQDVELQIKPCKEYCEKEGWTYDIVFEYVSGSKALPPKLHQILDLIAERHYNAFVTFNMDRFSRLKPATTEKMLSHITDCGCRFIALQQNLDSNNEMMWFTFKGLWAYFAHMYSQNLSERVKKGMELAKQKGLHVGRPKGRKDKKQRSKKGYYNRKRKFNAFSTSKFS